MGLEELRPGAVLAGYTIGRKLGQGGMGAVFEARDAANRVVALKVIARSSRRTRPASSASTARGVRRAR